MTLHVARETKVSHISTIDSIPHCNVSSSTTKIQHDTDHKQKKWTGEKRVTAADIKRRLIALESVTLIQSQTKSPITHTITMNSECGKRHLQASLKYKTQNIYLKREYEKLTFQVLTLSTSIRRVTAGHMKNDESIAALNKRLYLLKQEAQ